MLRSQVTKGNIILSFLDDTTPKIFPPPQRFRYIWMSTVIDAMVGECVIFTFTAFVISIKISKLVNL